MPMCKRQFDPFVWVFDSILSVGMWWYLIHLIGDGPQFWLRGDAQRADMKTCEGGGYYTLDFANMFMSKLFEHGGMRVGHAP